MVELSIVLVILGLLTGGILSGQSLIRAAELRSVTTEFQKYQAAVHTFRDRYFALPGDMTNATRFWGRALSAGDCVTTSSAAVITTGTCDGNGNGNIEEAPAVSRPGEIFQSWVQLSRAGLVEGNFTGISGDTSNSHAIVNNNVPSSKISNSGWTMYSIGDVPGNSQRFTMDYGNSITFGRPYELTSGTTSFTYAYTIRADEAWQIDSKIDDGRPAYGKATATGRFSPLASVDTCYVANTGALSITNYDVSYNLASASAACSFIFRNAF